MSESGRDLRLHLLGGFRVQVGSSVLPDVGRHSRAAALLKLLALALGHQLHREEVLDLLWPDFEPHPAANNLHRTLYAARRSLEPALPAGRPSAYLRLDAELLTLHASSALWVDVEAFELACTIARAGRDTSTYEMALALYTGDLLPEDRYVDWAAARRETLRERYVSLLLDFAGLYEARKEPWAAVRVLDRLVAAEPAHEEAHVHLLRLYAQAGLRSRALRRYRLLQESLRRELDAEPEPATQRLADDIAHGRFAAMGHPMHAVPRLVAEPHRRDLSAREAEVVHLIAQGLTNRQIAARLGLSTRTADTHVGHILRSSA